MVSITFPLDDKVFSVMARFPWVNWSSVSKEGLTRKRIFNEFIKTGELSEEDEEFCERTGWDPLDEMKVRGEFIRELKEAEDEPMGKAMTLEEFNEWCDEL